MFSREHMEKVVAIAREMLAGVDLDARARMCGLTLERQGEGVTISGVSLGEPFEVSLPPEGKTPDVMDLYFEGVVLHHLANTEDAALDGEYVSLFDMPEIRAYRPTLQRRVERPLVRAFAGAGRYLKKAVEAADGVMRDMRGGPVGAVWFLPRIPISLMVFEGDEELPSTATVLFDNSVRRMLPLEDIIIASELTAYRLKSLANRIRRNEEAENAENIAD